MYTTENKTIHSTASNKKTTLAKAPFFQPRLAINQPNDIYEQEADAMADKVMRMSDASLNNNSFFKPAISSVQRKCAHCEEEEKAQRKEAGTNEITAGTSTENYISSLNGKGKSLTQSERSFFEPRIGYDFSGVQLHTNSEANKSAQSINALAYTHGNNIVFGSNQYQPQTESGRHLMAHELTHVVQQNDSSNNIYQKSNYNKIQCAGTTDLADLEELGNDSEIDRGGETPVKLHTQPGIQRYLIGPPQRINAAPDASTPTPVYGHCRNFNYLINWNTDIRNGYIIQECINGDNITKCDGTNVAAPNIPHYWEAWYVDASGIISDGNTDTWFRGGKPGTKGRWTFDSNVFAVSALNPAWGFARSSVTTAGSLLATTTGPGHDELFQPSLSRHFGGQWDCCNGNDSHNPI